MPFSLLALPILGVFAFLVAVAFLVSVALPRVHAVFLVNGAFLRVMSVCRVIAVCLAGVALARAVFGARVAAVSVCRVARGARRRINLQCPRGARTWCAPESSLKSFKFDLKA